MPISRTPETPSPGDVKRISLFLICRTRLYRDAIIDLLNRRPGIAATGCGGATGAETIALVRAAAPDVVLLDTGPPDALALASQLARALPETRVLGFGVEDLPDSVIACANAGLRGYVPHTASTAELAEVARRVAGGETVCSADLGVKLFRHLRQAALNADAPAADLGLTARQRQILRLIEAGLSNKQIAQRLSLGTSTVKNHVHELLGRMGVGRRAEAAARIRHENMPH
jgi:two-component system, NarL family, nitrate/nitrite response regulator NarL